MKPRRLTYLIQCFFFIVFVLIFIAGKAESADKVKISGTLGNGTVFNFYAGTLTVSGGTAPYTWTQTGTLPTGLTFTPSGASAVISGMPTEVNTFAFTVSVTDGNTVDTADYTIKITATPCSFVGGAYKGKVSFSPINPSIPGTTPGTVVENIQIICEAGKAFTVEIDPSTPQPWYIAYNGLTIPFTIGHITGGTGAGATVIDLLTPTNHSISAADYQTKPAGLYTNQSVIRFLVKWSAPAGQITAELPATTGVYGAVSDTCTSLTGGSITFAIDPTAPGPFTPATTDTGTSPRVMCTKDSVHTVSCISDHLNKLTIGNNGITDPITYSITGCPVFVTGGGFGFATPNVPIDIGLTLYESAYKNAQEGAHSDTIKVQIFY